VNRKRVHRLWRREGLKVPARRRPKRARGASANGCGVRRATGRDDVWAWDFVHDRTSDGRGLKVPAVVDEWTRECLALRVGRTMGSAEVVETLRSLRRDGKTIVFASHRPDEVIALADRVLVMERGRLVSDTTPAELWPGDAGVQTVRLHLREASEHDAARLLREAGHAVHLNGRGLCVAVERDKKAGPIRTLTNASVEVRDFEILDDLVIEEARQ